jgi:hypothetical protein
MRLGGADLIVGRRGGKHFRRGSQIGKVNGKRAGKSREEGKRGTRMAAERQMGAAQKWCSLLNSGSFLAAGFYARRKAKSEW